MSEDLDKLVTFTIPLHNRSHYLEIILKYYKEAGFKGKFLFTDDSSEDELQKNEAIINNYKPFLDIEYYQVGKSPQFPFWTNMQFLLKKVTTKYVQLSADDDVFVLETLRACVQGMEDDPSVEVALGHCYYIDCIDTCNLNTAKYNVDDVTDETEKKRHCYKKHWQLLEASLSDDPVKRIMKQFYPEFTRPTMNGLQKTASVNNRLATCLENDLLKGSRTSMFTEFYWEYSIHLEGKTFLVDDFSWFRLHICHKKLKEFSPMRFMPKWSSDPSFSEAYTRFADLVEKKALEKGVDSKKAWFMGDVVWASVAVARLQRFRYTMAVDINKRLDDNTPMDFFSKVGRFIFRKYNNLLGVEKKRAVAIENKKREMENKWGTLIKSLIDQIEAKPN